MRGGYVVRTLILGVCALMAMWIGITVDAVAHGYGRNERGEVWTDLFDLEPGTTYTYTIRTDSERGERHRDDVRGELNLWRSPGRSDEIRFWYTIDGVRGNGTAPSDPSALVGAVLLSGLTGPQALSQEGLRALATPFAWIQWFDLFETSEFRRGTVWEVLQQPPLRFTAQRTGGRSQYSGEVMYGRETMLHLRIDLRRPLPSEVTSRIAGRRYTAELADPSQRRLLR